MDRHLDQVLTAPHLWDAARRQLPPPFLQFQIEQKHTVARGINNGGVVVGSFFDDGDKKTQSHGFLWDPDTGRHAVFNVPDGITDAGGHVLRVEPLTTIAAGVNDHGHIVGNFATVGRADFAATGRVGDYREYGFRLRGFDFTHQQLRPDMFEVIDLSAHMPNDVDRQLVATHATCINSHSTIAGRIFYPPPLGKAKSVIGFVLGGGGVDKVGADFTPIVVERPVTEVYGINTQEDVVGITWDTRTAGAIGYAFIQHLATSHPKPSAQPMGTGNFSRGRGINSAHTVVGQYTVTGNGPNNPGSGFLWTNPPFGNTPVSINVSTAPDWLTLWFGQSQAAYSTYAHGINDKGMIVGEFLDKPNGVTQAFLLDPIAWYLWRTLQASRWGDVWADVAPIPVPWWQRGGPVEPPKR